MGGANFNPRVACVKEQDILCWYRGLCTTVFYDCAGVQAIRAHLRKAAHPFDLPILQMDSRRGTETNHPRFQKSFSGFLKLIGGKNGLISAGSAVSCFFLCVLNEKKNPRVSQKINWLKFPDMKKKAKEKIYNFNACNMWTVVIAPPHGTTAVSARWWNTAFDCTIN